MTYPRRVSDGRRESETAQDQAIDLRVPMWNVAALVLLATGLLALNLFLPLGVGARAVTIAAALGALATAVIAYRMYLVADADGVGVRGVRRSYSITWSQLADVGIVERKINTMHLQLTLTDGTEIPVPQSLTAPGRPVARPTAYRQLQQLGRRILDYPLTHDVTT